MASTNSDSPGASAHCSYPSPPSTLFRHPQDWSLGGSVGIQDPDHSPSYYRRASYPYVRHDDPQHPHHQLLPDQLKMDNSSSSVVVPTQHILPAPVGYYPQPDSRPGSSHSQISNPSYMPPSHPVMTVMHTDDAASKETQYLRRRCFNCHQTEPPSWRRSTLNPGKIVCNKCGLYERTHLRARPHRFDELRASNKARKASQQTAPYPGQAPAKSGSPKHRNLNPGSFVKKEPHEYPLPHNHPRSRRGSTASSVSSGVSGSGNSDWDDSVSVYNSSSSAASSTYSSPVIAPFHIPNHPSPSPSFDGSSSNMPIRLPSAPMAGMSGSPVGLNSQRAHPPAKSHTAPYYADRRNPGDRRFTTGSVSSYDGPTWDGPPDVLKEEPKTATV